MGVPRGTFGDTLLQIVRYVTKLDHCVIIIAQRLEHRAGPMALKPPRTGVRPLSETGGGPTPRDGIIPVECNIHDGGPDFQHAPQRPAHLLLGIHSPMQQPLHRALCDRRRNWFFASAGCGVVDDDIRLSRNICLEITQKARHLASGGSNQRPIVGCNLYCNDSFGNEMRRHSGDAIRDVSESVPGARGANLPYTASFSSFAARNATFLLALI